MSSGPRRPRGPYGPKGPRGPRGPQSPQSSSSSITIVQHNANRNEPAHLGILDESLSISADIVLLQEPCYYSINGAYIPPQHPSFDLLTPVPTASFPKLAVRPRVLAYVRKAARIEASPRYDIVCDPDLQAIGVIGLESFLIFNIYNEKERLGEDPSQEDQGPSQGPRRKGASTVNRLLTHLSIAEPFLLAGDYNLHHPRWNLTADPAKTQQAAPLVSWLDSYKASLITDLDAAAERGGTFYRKGLKTLSIIDLAFHSPFQKLHWTNFRFLRATGSDHEPIAFDAVSRSSSGPSPPFLARPPLFNYKKADWDAFQKDLREKETSLLEEFERLISKRDLEEVATLLTKSVLGAARRAIPKKRLCERSKPWWNENISTLRKELAISYRRWKKERTDPLLAEWKAIRQAYGKAIKVAKKAFWEEFLGEASGKDVFTAYSYTKDRQSPSLPSIAYTKEGEQAVATTFTEKCDAFLSTLFPAPQGPPDPPRSPRPQSPSGQPQGYKGSKASGPRWEWPDLTDEEVKKAILSSPAKKAPGPDSLSFLPIQYAYRAVPAVFNKAYKALFSSGYHPKAWRQAIGIILPKPNKSDYSVPKAYRVIALLNCLGKTLEKLFATRLGYLANTAGLLGPTQLGGRKQRSAVDTALLLAHYVQQQQASRKKAITSTLLLDIKGAFDYVSKDQLLRVLERLGLPKTLISWVNCFVSNRKIQLAFEGQLQPLGDIAIGVPQGSPVSPILFLLYVRDIIASKGYQLSYIDDFSISITSTSARKNVRQLEEIASSLFVQAAAQKVAFDPGKTELIHFSRQREPILEGVRVGGLLIAPKQLVKWLGIWFDSGLRFRQHVEKKIAAAQAAFQGLSRLASTQKGLSFRATRQLYVACVTTIADYGAQLWFTGHRQQGLLKLFQRLQNQGLKKVLGTFKGSPTRALELEASIPPPEVRLRKACLAYSLRTLYFQKDHPVRQAYDQAARDDLADSGSDLGALASIRPSTQLFRLLRELLAVVGPSYKLERQKASWAPPWLAGPKATIRISEAPKGQAKLQHRQLLASLEFEDPLIFYTDGSQGTYQKALANSWSYCEIGLEGRPRKTASGNLGPYVEVADAELFAIYRVLVDLSRRPLAPLQQPTQLVFIFIDSQAAIRRLEGYSDLAIRIRGLLERLYLTYTIRLDWCPSHVGIFGNEFADRLAKKGLEAPFRGTPTASISYLRRKVRKTCLERWKTLWVEEETRGPKAQGLGKHYRRVKRDQLRFTYKPDPDLAKAPRPTLSAYYQLLFGIGYLKAYLKQTNRTSFEECRCGYYRHSTSHLLLSCSNYTKERQTLRKALRGQPLALPTLFSTKVGRKALLAFIEKTRVCTAAWYAKE